MRSFLILAFIFFFGITSCDKESDTVEKGIVASLEVTMSTDAYCLCCPCCHDPDQPKAINIMIESEAPIEEVKSFSIIDGDTVFYQVYDESSWDEILFVISPWEVAELREVPITIFAHVVDSLGQSSSDSLVLDEDVICWHEEPVFHTESRIIEMSENTIGGFYDVQYGSEAYDSIYFGSIHGSTQYMVDMIFYTDTLGSRYVLSPWAASQQFSHIPEFDSINGWEFYTPAENDVRFYLAGNNPNVELSQMKSDSISSISSFMTTEGTPTEELIKIDIGDIIYFVTGNQKGVLWVKREFHDANQTYIDIELVYHGEYLLPP